jgi:hypothetical protein
MGEDFITRQIRRTNRNLFLFGTVLLAIIGTIAGFTWRDVYNHLLGPFPIQSAELASIWSADVPQRYYLRVQGEKSFTTGMQEVDPGNHDHVRAEVVALVVGKRILLVKTPTNTQQLAFKGRLAPLPPQLQTQLVRAWDEKHPEAKGAILPYLLDATGIWDRDTVMVAIAGGIFVALGLLLIGISLRRQAQPDKHPLLAKLQQYGLVHDVRMQIDSEMRAEGGGERFGPLHFTTNWVVQALAYKTHVMQVRDVVWAYPKVTKHYHSGIPTGKSYSAIIRDSKGQSLEVNGKKDSVPQLLQSLQRRMPWILVGFSKELEALWQKEKPKFFALTEQRRAKLSMAR